MISHSDILYNPEIFRRLVQYEADITLTFDTNWLSLWQEKFTDPLEDAETFRCENEIVREIGQRPRTLEEVNGQFMGPLKFTRFGWKQIEARLGQVTRNSLDMTTFIRKLIADGVDFHGGAIDGRWCEVDSENDLSLYRRRLLDAGWSHNWRPHLC